MNVCFSNVRIFLKLKPSDMKNLFILITATCTFLFSSAQTFTLKSNDIGGQATQKQMLNAYGCTGENASPQLFWENAPEGTQSFAVTMYDKDAPTGSGFWHWVVFNIPANITELKSGAGDITKSLMPQGAIQSNSDGGRPGYGGPCPQPGPAHLSLITAYALKSKLTLDKNATPAMVGLMINNNLIAKASLVMYAQR
jgi:Raf kinase inhibitor-like YbhB/YbcL family protein